ncbi:MAG TPA: PA domain-containing protein [Polyangiaceae bacterium]
MTRPLHQRFVGGLALLGLTLAPALASAKATFTLVNMDAAGTGFNDTTPATPVGGNTGTTLGAQRKIAFQFALDRWGNVLESAVPIVVEASFGPLMCDQTGAILGHAGSTHLIVGQGLPDGQIYSDALADAILGMDVEPGGSDIQAEFNGALDSCSIGLPWYYGLDAMPPRNSADLVSTVLHEITHGLGFLTTIDPETGEPSIDGSVDAFSAHLLDRTTKKHWSEMLPNEIVASGQNARGLVWDGSAVTNTAKTVLTPGMPLFSVTPAIGALRGNVIDVNFGPKLTPTAITAPLAVPNPADACSQSTTVTPGTIAVITPGQCSPLNAVYDVEVAGAVAALLTDPSVPPSNADVWNGDLTVVPLGIPSLGISAADAQLLLATAGAQVSLSVDAARGIGVDPDGHVYMYASVPINGASTGSHWDPIARPDLLMEPAQSVNTSYDFTLERAALRDIGWPSLCGNGATDPGEECDDGAANSDTAPNACRTSCVRASCGDSVLDTGERCDNGAANSDTKPDACRTSCQRASCGDGVIDSGEQCDSTNTALCVQCKTVSQGASGSGSGGSATGGASSGGASSGGASSGGASSGGASGNQTNSGGSANAGGAAPARRVPPQKSGCSCGVASPANDGSLGLAALALAIVAARRRARQARQS